MTNESGSWQVYRVTDSGRLWAGPNRLRHRRDPAPAPSGEWGRTYYLGPGTVLSWQTSRSDARSFPSAIGAARLVQSQGWPAVDLRVIRADAMPDLDDAAPAVWPRAVLAAVAQEGGRS